MSEEVVRKIIRETVRETLTELGFDVEHPIEMQADLRALREWRLLMRSARKSAILAFIGTVIGGTLLALWVGIKSLVH